jgi:hypothetical protein
MNPLSAGVTHAGQLAVIMSTCHVVPPDGNQLSGVTHPYPLSVFVTTSHVAGVPDGKNSLTVTAHVLPLTDNTAPTAVHVLPSEQYNKLSVVL